MITEHHDRNHHFDAVMRAAQKPKLARNVREAAIEWLKSLGDDRAIFDEWDSVLKEARK